MEYIRRAYTSEGIDSQMKEMHAYYDRIAREYEEESVRTHKRDQENMGPFLKARSELRDIIKNSAEGTVCQIGIGTGDWTRAVCETAKIVVGVEVSQEMLAKAKHNLASFDNVYFVNCDFLKEDIEAGPFDCVVVFFLLSLFPRSQQDLFFHQVQKILKPKGLLVVADTKKLGDLPSIGLGRRQLQQRRSGDKVYTLYKEHFFNDSLASLLEGKGYEIIDRSIGTTWFSWVVSCRRT
jgi:ubiquinone/menaquinone biosynthesis C-methylase UbiE